MTAWKVELIISLARVILNNNYVESSQGIYKLTNCLAMGMSASPACLNTVGLVSEYKGLNINLQMTDNVDNLVIDYERYLMILTAS